MHEAMAHWLQNPDDDLVGQMFNDHVITQEDVDTLLTPAWDSLVDLQEIYGGGFKVTHLEKRVAFPGIAGAFGTVDVILKSRPTSSSPISNSAPASTCRAPTTTRRLNSQLLFYLGRRGEEAGQEAPDGHRHHPADVSAATSRHAACFT